MTTWLPQVWREDELTMRNRLALLVRVVELRRVGLIDPIWVDNWQVRIRPLDAHLVEPAPISWDELERRVVTAEALLGPRKPPGAAAAGAVECRLRA